MRWTVLVVLLAFLAGCGAKAAQSDRRAVASSGFTGVSTTAGIDLVVTTSAAGSVEVSASPQVIDHIVVETRGETLWIGLRPGTAARGRWLASQARVDVALPVLSRLEVSDGSRARVNLHEPGVELSVTLTRGSQLSGRLECAGLLVAASGSSVAELTGSANRITLAGSDGAKLRLTGLPTAQLDAVLSGGSMAAVSVSQRITVDASGGAGLSFRGDARVEKQILSGGAWIRRD